MNSPRRLREIALLAAVMLTGCESADSNRPAASRTAPLVASPYQKVGVIEYHDPASATVVVRLDQQTRLDKQLYVRDSNLTVTAVLRPTGLHTGRSVGMVVVQGTPTPGLGVYRKTDD